MGGLWEDRVLDLHLGSVEGVLRPWSLSILPSSVKCAHMLRNPRGAEKGRGLWGQTRSLVE